MKMIGCKEIDYYINGVKSGKIKASSDVVKQCLLVEECFANEKLFVDKERLANYIKIGEKLFDVLYDWEKFLLAIIMCTYKMQNGKYRPRWFWFLILIARGAGKDGFIAWLSLCAISRFNPVSHYDVDICANNEDQAMRPVLDVVEWLNNPEYIEKNKKSFKWTIEKVVGLKNRGRIRGHTNSPKGKDGLRSGCVILNEIHQYEDYSNIKVFTTGLGKVEDARRIYFTTNGDVREGVLDGYLKTAELVLNGEESDEGRFFFLCRLDNKEEVHDKENWYKANPSLQWNESLLHETEIEYAEWKKEPLKASDFMTKRMNLPESAKERAVVDYQYIKDTNKPLIDLSGMSCVAGVDLSRTTDFCSVSLLFRKTGKKYVISHTWVCTASSDWEEIRIKDQFPLWEEMGILTVVDDIEINPELIAEWIQHQKSNYNILKIAIDDFRQSIFSRALSKIGFTRDNKNLKLVRLSDIAKVVPVIESDFINGNIIVGDNPIFRWCANNTKVVSWKTRNTEEGELGNQVYAKIDKRSRKTDSFMAFVAATTVENELPDPIDLDISKLRAVAR